MKHLPTVAGILLGLCFLAASIPVLFNLFTMPKLPDGTPAAHFMAAFGPTGYIKFVKMFEFVGGLLVMVPRLRNLGLLLLGPVIVNIIAFHAMVEDPNHLKNPMLIIIIVCALYLLWDARKKFAAPPGQVFPHVNELRNWPAWDPWGKLDPNMKTTYDGPPSGVGASYTWSGNGKVGAGRNTITQSVPNELVRFRLEFQKPMVATNTVEFTFLSDDSQTTLTWAMSGKNNLGGKIFGLFMNCEKMCAKQFDKGLAEMKAVIEGAGKAAVSN